ncbi:NAD(P)-binding protein [Hypericibacter sp.]|uniref:NAD(P)-binding protein n=1 Tax=Hypericibacter sp. TaxID=2705401 RepID=UPI003D6D3709
MNQSLPENRPSTAAATALAAGRLALAESFRLHRPRGAFCHAGWCQQCRVTLPDGRIALACRTAVLPRPLRSGWRQLLGRCADRLPPWFYESRLLRPRALRQFYLERLRHLSAAPALPRTPAPVAGRWHERSCEVLVVGGGLAGLAAARAQRAAGRDVLLVEAEAGLGGRARFQPAMMEALAKAVPDEGPHLLETLCVGLYEQARQALLIGPDGPTLLAFRELVVATGAYDRLPGFAGNDLPGIIGLRAFERLVATDSIPRTWRVGLVADIAHAVAALATGARFAWVAGPGDLPRTQGPSFPRATLLAAEGRGAVAAVRLDPGGRQPCDLLVIGFSQPSYELQMQAGQQAMLAGSPSVVLTVGDAVIPMTVVGDAALKPSSSARLAAASSSRAFLCLCEDVRRRDAEAAIADGFADVELLKRRTGAGTGPCQGKLCHGEMLACLAEAGRPVALPTVRPLLRPVTLAELAASEERS